MVGFDSSSLDKGKSRQRSLSTYSFANKLNEALSDYDSQSSTYYELPSSHFLAQAGGLPSSSSWSGTKQGLFDNHSSGKDSQSYAKVDARSAGSFSSDDREQLSFIPEHITQGFQNLNSHLSGGQQDRTRMPDTSTLAAADFDVDVRSGFLPPEPPVSRLQGIEEEIWESALDKARVIPLRIGGGGKDVLESSRQQSRQWRRSIREMLVLHPSPQITSDIRFARRAHLVLSWLAHLYIHSQPNPVKEWTPKSSWLPRWSSPSQDEQDKLDELVGKYAAIVPASIAIPWVSLSKQLDIPPILTYATSVLWNWNLRDPSLGFQDDNVFVTTTFSGTTSEEHFFKTSVLIEKRGVAALTLMRRSLDEAFIGDSLARRRISRNLQLLSRVIEDLTKFVHDMRLGCDPSTFYWGIRPWFNGGDSFVDKETGEKGWIYEGVEEYQGKRKVLMGPSAGQSSLIHSLDVFLGVDHSRKAERVQSASAEENATFMEKMQIYMPGHHRNFLTHLKSISFSTEEEIPMETEENDEEEEEEHQNDKHPLRSLMRVQEGKCMTPAVEMLQKSYNDTLDSLKHFRDEHMRIATMYIIQQMRQTPPAEYARLDPNLVIRSNLADGLADERSEKGVKGTGGTDLVSFLKDCRKNTVSALHR